MTEPTFRENRINKMRQASAKFLALKAGFEKKAREARADFEEANRIWNETAKNFPPEANSPPANKTHSRRGFQPRCVGKRQDAASTI